MKKISIILVSYLLVFFNHAAFGAPQILTLESDNSSYGIGQRALLRAKINVKPNKPNQEVILVSTLDGNPLEVLSFSSRYGYSLTAQLSTVGMSNWTVRAYVQDKNKALEYEKIILYYQKENIDIEDALAKETDHEIRNYLTTTKIRNLAIINNTKARISENRIFLGQETLSFVVSFVVGQALGLNPYARIESDRESQIYNVGERANFFAELLTDITSAEGYHEIYMDGKIESSGSMPELVVKMKRISEKTFSFQSPIFTSADLGTRRFVVTVKTRPKKQADSIREAIRSVRDLKLQYQSAQNQSFDPMDKIYYQNRINMLQVYETNLPSHLNEILTTFISNLGLRFDVQ
ncbi:hypothetical protein QJS83_16630 [Bdellovibrio sp. 22V]|uniref:hypothetical protein n=1 Tax=Bdellovibrio sp. 22V TaxID=3044166 RepID=UPI0025434055|nr:hypothetical protein [Bdellovibrio sp. 22V]WII72089.1 hypothetical protein QJS83_16630 [Bdellovibrio sp. 22V]